MKRLIPLLWIIGILLTSCSSNTGPATSFRSVVTSTSENMATIHCPTLANKTVVVPTAPVSASLTVAGWSSTSAEDALVSGLLADFQHLHPTIKIRWVSINSNYPDRMSFLTNTGHLPDAFFIRPDMAPAYISQQKLLDLSPYMQRDHVQMDAYYPSLFAPFVCDHTVYGIPKDWGTLGIVYNKTLFRQAGLAFPDVNWTWNDLRAAARKLTHRAANGGAQYGISLPDSSERWLAFLFAAGGSVLNAAQNKAAFDSPEAVNALNFYSSMQLQDHSSILPGSLDATWSGQAFGGQQVAMVIEGGWLIPYAASNFPSIDYGIAPLPLGPLHTRANLLFTNAWAASASTKYPEASWELIQYMTSAAVQSRVLHSGLAQPSLANFTHDPYIQQSPNIRTLFDARSYSILDYYGPQDTFIHNRLDIAIQNVLLGRMSAQEALANAAAQVDARLQP